MVGLQRGWPDGMGSRGQAERHRQVGEPEGISVSKAGACQCALSGRSFQGVKPGGTAEACIASVPAGKARDRGVFLCPDL